MNSYNMDNFCNRNVLFVTSMYNRNLFFLITSCFYFSANVLLINISIKTKTFQEGSKNEENKVKNEIKCVFIAYRRNIEFQLGYFVKH